MGITDNIVGPLTSSNKTNSINMRLLLVSVFIALVALSAASPAWVERSFHAKRSETNERSFEDQPQEKSEESEEKEMRSAEKFDEEVMKKSHEPNPDVPSRDHGAKRGMGAPGMGLQRQMRASRGMGSMRDQRGFDEEQMMRRGFGGNDMPNMPSMRGMSPDFNMKRGFGANSGAAANKRSMNDAPMKEEKKSYEENMVKDERNVNSDLGQDPFDDRGMFDMRGMEGNMAPMMRGMMSPQNAKRGAPNARRGMGDMEGMMRERGFGMPAF